MKIFKDSSLKEEVTTLDLGIVQAGSSKQFEFYIYNDTEADLMELNFSIDNNEIKIISTFKELGSKKSDKLIIEWSPSITIKKGLSTKLNINGLELWK